MMELDISTLRKTETIDSRSELFPERLRAIKNPPRALYARGNLDLLNAPNSVSVVGTRDVSSNGLKITDRLTRYLVDKGFSIVSGLALRIDLQAHSSCLEIKGNTIAVLAHGLDRIYPAQNSQVAQSILLNNALWVSEHPDGISPQKHFFVLRNRIQVGLSRFSIVIEADVNSGTMSHAKYCVEAGHRLFAVLPKGPNSLGAIAIRTRDDYVLLT